MNIDATTAAGLAGIQKGMQGMHESAATIASAGASGDAKTMTEAMVALQMQATQVEASAKAVDLASDTIGTLIDVLA